MIDLPGKISNDIGKFIAFRSCNPFKPQSFGRKANKFKEVFHHRHSLGCDVVTLSVMAAPDMAAGYQDTVRPFLESLQDEMRRYSSAAHDANRQDISSIF